jgi:uncharacterized membrane protein
MTAKQNTPASVSGSLIGTIQRSTMRISRRPGNEITVEEMRLDIASRVGPLRIQASGSREFTIVEGIPIPVMVGKGQNMLPTYVRIELVKGETPCDIAVSNQLSSSPTLTQFTTPYIDLIVLAGELLFVTAFNTAAGTVKIKVSEVIV